MSEQTPIYIFIGPPGAGKGSLARLCQKRHGWHTVSTGDLCRQHIALQTEIGKEIDFCIKSGKLIHNETVVNMVRDWLNENLATTSGVILDGFPRTYEQAQSFHAVLNRMHSSCCVRVVELQLHDARVIERLTSRRICSNNMCQNVYTYADTSLAPQQYGICDICGSRLTQRDDDVADVVADRLQTYYDTAESLLSFYRDRPEFIGTLHADKPLHDVYNSFMTLMR